MWYFYLITVHLYHLLHMNNFKAISESHKYLYVITHQQEYLGWFMININPLHSNNNRWVSISIFFFCEIFAGKRAYTPQGIHCTCTLYIRNQHKGCACSLSNNSLLMHWECTGSSTSIITDCFSLFGTSLVFVNFYKGKILH